MTTWQAIDSAPTKGEYDIFLKNGVREANVRPGKFGKYKGWADRRGAAVALEGDATHWMPIPEPPSTLTDLERAGAGDQK